jgi:uncharacterized protein (UPF0335 family)
MTTAPPPPSQPSATTRSIGTSCVVSSIRIERLEDEKIALSEDLRGLYAEARSSGFDTAALRQVIKLCRQDAAERQERQRVVDEYLF